MTVRIMGIRNEGATGRRHSYRVTIEGSSREPLVEVDESTGLRVFKTDDLVREVGRPAASLICRMVDMYDRGEEITFPQEVVVN